MGYKVVLKTLYREGGATTCPSRVAMAISPEGGRLPVLILKEKSIL
jgi:hypothetical protein